MTRETFIYLLLLLGPPLTHLAEAWLEEVVIRLKNPNLPDYDRRNRQEHRRSFIYSAAVLLPYGAIACLFGLYWLLGTLIISRRMIFDPSLKLWRGRRLDLYEGAGPVDSFFSGIFGSRGALWEFYLELAVTIGLVIVQILNPF
jgi:hypothetical protein